VKLSSKNSGAEIFHLSQLPDWPRRKAKKPKVSSSNLGVVRIFCWERYARGVFH
jgi:hypothetical protein